VEGVVGEFDGKMKYRVPAGASAEEAAEGVWREKKREDRLRRWAAPAGPAGPAPDGTPPVGAGVGFGWGSALSGQARLVPCRRRSMGCVGAAAR
jgi:hypothetical protein